MKLPLSEGLSFLQDGIKLDIDRKARELYLALYPYMMVPIFSESPPIKFMTFDEFKEKNIIKPQMSKEKQKESDGILIDKYRKLAQRSKEVNA